MNPVDVNMMVASISNYLYENLPEDDFECLALFLNELSKSMFTMSIFEKLCQNDHDHRHRHIGKKGGINRNAAAAAESQPESEIDGEAVMPDNLPEDIALAEVDPKLAVLIPEENQE